MYKVGILGCENSHADHFLKAVIQNKLVSDVEFVGVYSCDAEAAQKLSALYGVPCADTYDAFVGKVDGIIITARHGDNHYKYAKPYLETGIPMFIDKPITCTEMDAKVFMQALESRSIQVSGGSVCVLDDYVQELKQAVKTRAYGPVYGGYLRAPVIMDSPFGGFFFYAQHLAQVMTEIFGCYPESVRAWKKGKLVHCDVHYPDYDVDITYVPDSDVYYASISCEQGVFGSEYTFSDGFSKEFLEFYRLLKGEAQRQSYEDFFAPVYVLNAIYRSLESGRTERVKRAADI